MELNFVLLLAFAIALAAGFLRAFLWLPLRVKRAFERQGVQCLPYHMFLGNLRELIAMVATVRSATLPLGSNDVGPRLLPYYFKWKKDYGSPLLFWLATKPVLTVADPELIRDILSNKFGHYRKFVSRPEFNDLVGTESIGVLEGERWVKHRRIVSSVFLVQKLKNMSPTMVACIAVMLERWKSEFSTEGGSPHKREVNVHTEFKSLTADIIAHTAFGSSYEEGKLVFQRQLDQQVLIAKLARQIYIPGSRFWPTAENRYRWRLNKEIESAVHRIIQNRGQDAQDATGNDLLGVLMAAGRKELPGTQENLSLSLKEIVDECKTFFFAGHETTATLMTWTIMLLAYHQDWQEKTREEVLKIFGKQTPDAESLNSLKLVSMVINEALRLYPPAILLLRETTKRMNLGRLLIPPGTLLFIPIIDLHHDPSIWGSDALEFNPQRFADGLAKACTTPLAFIPFSMGPRNCLGQHFALLEARLILTMMLQRFRFSISPSYQHAPTTLLTLQPKHGMQIMLEMIT